ncbi:MAG: hypothetical protein ACTTKD_09805 [Peptoanaerobacter stomatis]|uniref:hypothetical protein n=1 Tax=Peptoanaerobacter stomatis TaxID=796937 RepID=UPI003FA09E88
MYCLKDDILIRRIGNKMYIVIEKDYDNIYEFEEDSFNIIRIMVKLKKFEIKELIHNLQDEYIIDDLLMKKIDEFINTMKFEGILENC